MTFELLLFSTDPAAIGPAVAGGCSGIIVDWEHLGKVARQTDADTQINHDTVDDLRRVCACTDANVICRINGFGPQTRGEIGDAAESGADEILLPMVRTTRQVEEVLRWCDGRLRLGILIETVEAVEIVAELSQLPLARVYVGLNDLAVARQTSNIFMPLIDGMMDRIRAPFTGPFGFGGLTDPALGRPIPCRLLIAEMVRLGCSFSFLRRSYHRDVERSTAEDLLRRLNDAFEAAGRRTPDQVARDRRELTAAVESWR